jgi:alcohol dehydrogenase (NADP+)
MDVNDYIAIAEEEDWAQKHRRTLVLVVSTVLSPSLPLEGHLRLLSVSGAFIQVGVPKDNFPVLSVFALIRKGLR